MYWATDLKLTAGEIAKSIRSDAKSTSKSPAGSETQLRDQRASAASWLVSRPPTLVLASVRVPPKNVCGE